MRELRTAAPAVVDVGTAAFTASREAAVAADRTLVVVTPDAYAAAAGRELVTALARAVRPPMHSPSSSTAGAAARVSLRSIARTVGAPVAAAVGGDDAGMGALANGRLRLERWPARSHAAALRDLAAELAG